MSTQGVEFESLNVTVAGNRQLLHDITLRIEPNTTTALLGRSGSGKTTLLRTVNALVRPTTGHVLVGDQDVSTADPITLRRSIGYVIQETGLFPHFTVERNVGIVLEAEGRSREERARRSDDLLRAVGLDATSFGRRYPHQLSGGQRQRVGLARALAADPSALLMDEPFGALDPLTRGEMQDMLRELLGRLKKTVLLVTHDLNEALYLGDQIALLNEGKLIACLPRDKFLSSDLTEVRAYVASVQRGERSAEEAARR